MSSILKNLNKDFAVMLRSVWKTLKKIGQVLQARGWFIVIGFLIGTICVYLSIPIHGNQALIQYIGENGADAIALVIKEIGVGFFVAAIAVFGYEWGSHSKELYDLVKKFLKMGENEGLETIKLILKDLFNNCEEAEEFQKHIYDIVQISHEIAKHNSSANLSAKKQYLKEISRLLDRPIKENFNLLKEWLLEEGEGRAWDYSMPYTRAQITGSIYATQMAIIHKTGGFYQSVSRISYWEGNKLDYFFKETEEALKNGITVKRVFNLCDTELESFIKGGKKSNPKLPKPQKNKMKRILKIINRHEQLAQENAPYYQVKFFFREKISAVRETLEMDQNKIENAGYGIFKSDLSDYYIRIIAEDENLLKINLAYCKEKDQFVRLFDLMWENSVFANPFQNFKSHFTAEEIKYSPSAIDAKKAIEQE